MQIYTAKFLTEFVISLSLLGKLVHCAVGDIRLVGGDYEWEGRVEVYHDGAWGTIINYEWDINDATVVCKSLGFGGAANPVYSAAFGPGSGNIWFDVGCTGKESNIFDCPYEQNGTEHFNHCTDAGVRCQDLRLHGGDSDREGRLEVYYNGAWGTVCNDTWDFQDANIVCHELGFGDASTEILTFQRGSDEIILDNVQCHGNESRLFQCPSSGMGNHNCDHSQVVGVKCTDENVNQDSTTKEHPHVKTATTDSEIESEYNYAAKERLHVGTTTTYVDITTDGEKVLDYNTDPNEIPLWTFTKLLRLSTLSKSTEITDVPVITSGEQFSQNIERSNLPTPFKILIIAVISSTSSILLLILLGWVCFRCRRRQVARIRRQPTMNYRVLPPLHYGPRDASSKQKHDSKNHTVSPSLDIIYESISDHERSHQTNQSTCYKDLKKRSNSEQGVEDYFFIPVDNQPSNDYATYTYIPELLSSDTDHVVRSIVQADVHRLATFATCHRMDQAADIDASGYPSPNVEMSSKNLNPSHNASSNDRYFTHSPNGNHVDIRVATIESDMLGKVGDDSESPKGIGDLDGRNANEVNGFNGKTRNDDEVHYEVLENSHALDTNILEIIAVGGITSGDNDAGNVAVDEIRESHRNSIGYEVTNDSGKANAPDLYFAVTNDTKDGNDGNLGYEVVPGLNNYSNPVQVGNQTESDDSGYLVPNIGGENYTNISESTTVNTEAIQHTYLDCGTSLVNPTNSSLVSEDDDKGSGGPNVLSLKEDTIGMVGNAPHANDVIDEMTVDGVGYLVPGVHHIYLDCSGSILVERSYSEIGNEVGKNSLSGPQHFGKSIHRKNTSNDSSMIKKLSVSNKDIDETYSPRLEHTYHGLEDIAQRLNQDESFKLPSEHSSGENRTSNISMTSGVPLGLKEDKEGHPNLDKHGYMVLDDTPL